jgi:multiple sugar transport system permease protein
MTVPVSTLTTSSTRPRNLFSWLRGWFHANPATVMLGPAILVLLVFTIFPSIYSLVLSFQDWNIEARNSHWVFQGLKYYQRVLTDPRALQAFCVTGIFIAGSVFSEIFFGLLIALLLDQQRRGTGLTRTVILLPMMTTPVVVGLIWRLMFNTDVGWINFVLHALRVPGLDWLGSPHTALLSIGVADVWEWTPFVTIILLAALKAMPMEPVEAAKVDGAGPFQIFRLLTLPYLRPAIGVCVLLRVIDSVKSFDLFYVLTGGGPGTATEIIGLYTYKQGFNFFKLDYAAALSYSTLILVVIFANIAIFSGLFRQTR